MTKFDRRNFFYDLQTPLSYACAEALTDVVAELVHRHAYVNTVDKVNLIERELFHCTLIAI